ncbi:MAG: S41 family peptidase [Chitinophagales bacterium]|nr:S41 family peptidase [Chitinophagales bacterium]
MEIHLRNLFFTLSLLVSIQVIGQQREIEKLGSTMELINTFYVDTVNNKKLVDEAIVKMLEELDPHSVYIPAKDVKKANEPLVGNFEGVGIQFNILKDTILVVATISGGPSEKVGLMAGDKIVMIDEENSAGVGFTNRDVVNRLRGDKGTKVTVGIKRKGSAKLIDFTITRDKIPLFSVDASYMATPTTGYIKINRFAAKTVMEFNEALEKLRAQGLENLILDLQGNGGGYLNAAFDLADQFAGANELIVYTQGRRSPKQILKATSAGVFEKGKLIVLVNESSASASEIVAGAVQDLDRGIVIGRQTFGKGLVQKPFKLNDGSMIRLTIAKYYTPSGRCIQRPYEEGKREYYKDIRNRLKKGELMSMDSIDFPDSLSYLTSNGRKVFGGGGIMPDIFVPLDTNEISDYYTKVVRKGILNQFVLSYLDHNRDDLKAAHVDLQHYKENFSSEKILTEFVAYAEKEGVEKNEEDLKRSSNLMGVQLKALIARNLWNSSAYFEIFNDINPSVQEALKVMDSKMFKQMKIAYK